MSSSSLIRITAPYDEDLLHDLRMLLKKHFIFLEEKIKESKSKAERNFFLKEKSKICVESSDGL